MGPAANPPSRVRRGPPTEREAGVVLFNEINLLINTTPALRATPPQLRRGTSGMIRIHSQLLMAAATAPNLQAVIHIELYRMRRHAEARDFFHLEFDVRINHVVAEDAALRKECAVLVEVVQSFVQDRK